MGCVESKEEGVLSEEEGEELGDGVWGGMGGGVNRLFGGRLEIRNQAEILTLQRQGCEGRGGRGSSKLQCTSFPSATKAARPADDSPNIGLPQGDLELVSGFPQSP